MRLPFELANQGSFRRLTGEKSDKNSIRQKAAVDGPRAFDAVTEIIMPNTRTVLTTQIILRKLALIYYSFYTYYIFITGSIVYLYYSIYIYVYYSIYI